MKFVKKFIASLLAFAMLCSSSSANAQDYYYEGQDYCVDTGGYCYEDCRRAPCITPAIALGAVALIAIVAVAIQNSSSDHSH